jgi:hypothetical protein
LKNKKKVHDVKKALRTVAPADPSLWNESDQGAVQATFTREYRDAGFQCRHCRAACVFTADDQKLHYEVKKAPINQQRVLCQACWTASHGFAAAIGACQAQWAGAKQSLARDAGFLQGWLALLVASEKYGRRPNGATSNMLRKLMEKLEGA